MTHSRSSSSRAGEPGLDSAIWLGVLFSEHKSKRPFAVRRACKRGVFHALAVGYPAPAGRGTPLWEPAATSLLTRSGSRKSEGKRAVLLLSHHSAFSFCLWLRFAPLISAPLVGVDEPQVFLYLKNSGWEVSKQFTGLDICGGSGNSWYRAAGGHALFLCVCVCGGGVIGKVLNMTCSGPPPAPVALPSSSSLPPSSF